MCLVYFKFRFVLFCLGFRGGVDASEASGDVADREKRGTAKVSATTVAPAAFDLSLISAVHWAYIPVAPLTHVSVSAGGGGRRSPPRKCQ